MERFGQGGLSSFQEDICCFYQPVQPWTITQSQDSLRVVGVGSSFNRLLAGSDSGGAASSIAARAASDSLYPGRFTPDDPADAVTGEEAGWVKGEDALGPGWVTVPDEDEVAVAATAATLVGVLLKYEEILLAG